MKIWYVPGNHDIWVARSGERDSLMKYTLLTAMAGDYDIETRPDIIQGIEIIPLHGWYDYTFGGGRASLEDIWLDYSMCRWPGQMDDTEIAERFLSMNRHLKNDKKNMRITFSHYLPRIDIMPEYIPPSKRTIYPVLGSYRLETVIRKIHPSIHVYGHSHVNRQVTIDGITYINNAYGYPHETRITSKRLLKIHG